MSRARWRTETLGAIVADELVAPAGYGLSPDPPETLDEFWVAHGKCLATFYGRDEMGGEIAFVECQACFGSQLWFMIGGGPVEIYHGVDDES